jgi:hypothetical protein
MILPGASWRQGGEVYEQISGTRKAHYNITDEMPFFLIKLKQVYRGFLRLQQIRFPEDNFFRQLGNIISPSLCQFNGFNQLFDINPDKMVSGIMSG